MLLTKKIEKLQSIRRGGMLLFLFFLALQITKAQEAIPASGGNASGEGGSVSYTIGQAAYTSNSGNYGTVAEGVQQPYEIYVITGNDQLSLVTLSFKAFPNPTTDYLILSTVGEEKRNLTYLLSDVNGKIIGSGDVSGEQTTIPMGTYRSGNYFLQILLANSALKSFKIVKK